jgi:hypothetical protein
MTDLSPEHKGRCFRRLTVTGRVSQLNKATAHGICGLSLRLTVERAPRRTKVLRVCGDIWGSQIDKAEKIVNGSVVTLVGYLNGPIFDLEQVLEVT